MVCVFCKESFKRELCFLFFFYFFGVGFGDGVGFRLIRWVGIIRWVVGGVRFCWWGSKFVDKVFSFVFFVGISFFF